MEVIWLHDVFPFDGTTDERRDLRWINPIYISKTQTCWEDGAVCVFKCRYGQRKIAFEFGAGGVCAICERQRIATEFKSSLIVERYELEMVLLDNVHTVWAEFDMFCGRTFGRPRKVWADLLLEVCGPAIDLHHRVEAELRDDRHQGVSLKLGVVGRWQGPRHVQILSAELVGDNRRISAEFRSAFGGVLPAHGAPSLNVEESASKTSRCFGKGPNRAGRMPLPIVPTPLTLPTTRRLCVYPQFPITA